MAILANAVMLPESELLRLLLDSEVNVNGPDGIGNTALMVAAVHGRVENVKILLSAGAGANAINNDVKTALDLAKQHEQKEVANVLQATNSW